MTTKLAKLEPTDRVNVALEVFRVNKFHALPVVEGEDMLKGIVTTFDIIDYLARDAKADMSYKYRRLCCSLHYMGSRVAGMST